MTTSAPPPDRRTILRNSLDAAHDELDAAVEASLVAATTAGALAQALLRVRDTTPPEATPHTEEHR